MKLTKYTHACFVLEKEGATLVVDPGKWSSDFIIPSTVAAVVITHEHPDHFDIDKLRRVIAENPNALVVAHPSITAQVADLPTRGVDVGESISVGPFTLKFFGGQHAVIHPSFPRVANLGVMVDERLYYPGDSFVLPDMPVDTLLLPISAPWLKVSEVLDFVAQVKSRQYIPTHDAILSDTGKALLDRIVSGGAEATGSTYQRLDGQSIVLE
mgnify:CR=1 FL=1